MGCLSVRVVVVYAIQIIITTSRINYIIIHYSIENKILKNIFTTETTFQIIRFVLLPIHNTHNILTRRSLLTMTDK